MHVWWEEKDPKEKACFCKRGIPKISQVGALDGK